MPVVCSSRVGIIDNGLSGVHKVTRGLHLRIVWCVAVGEPSLCEGALIGVREGMVCRIGYRLRCPVFLLGIYVTAALAGLHVEEVELDDTRNRTIHFVAVGIELLHQFKEYTRSLCHDIGCRTVVLVLGVEYTITLFIIEVALAIIGSNSSRFASSCELYVRGERSEEVGHVVNTEVVAVRVGAVAVALSVQ